MDEEQNVGLERYYHQTEIAMQVVRLLSEFDPDFILAYAAQLIENMGMKEHELDSDQQFFFNLTRHLQKVQQEMIGFIHQEKT